MSWSIALIKNTLTIPESAHQRVARALMLTLGAEDEAEVISHRFGADGGLKFHGDDMEHMDYLTWDDKACEEIAAAGGQGHVLFGSLEGDNKGQFWGAEFKDGVWTRLTATVQASCGPRRPNPLHPLLSERFVMSVQYLITHSGSFHADEVCAAVILSRVFPNASVVRTRDERVIEDAASVSVIFDVGRVYDPQKNRFDHHMRGARAREDGTVYSSFGLIWDHFGREYLRAVGVEDEDVEAVWTRFDSEFVLPVDQIDTGTLSPSKIGVAGGITISALIATMNPPFDESTPKSQGAAFNLAMELAQTAVRARVTALAADVRADKGVEAAIRSNGDAPVLVLPHSLDAQPTIDRLGARHVLAIVTPSSSGGWGVTVARTSANSYENVIDMPDAWAGLSGPDLEAVSGVPGATFCHSAKFYAAADTKEAALEMARITVESALDTFPSP